VNIRYFITIYYLTIVLKFFIVLQYKIRLMIYLKKMYSMHTRYNKTHFFSHNCLTVLDMYLVVLQDKGGIIKTNINLI